jgi:putative endonuclease
VVDRRSAERRGHLAEFAALCFLRCKGYRLLARRYKSPVGEIDLIMRRGDVTAFIEVKQRIDLDASVLAVSNWQARRISAAARSWMGRDPIAASQACRFDIVAVSPYLLPRHIENAFEGDQ